MTTFKTAALAALMFMGTGALAVDFQVDQLVHRMEAELEALESEVHDHHLNSHLDADVHEVEAALEAFHEHVAHGDGHLELRHQLAPLRAAVQHMNATANSMGHWHTGPFGFLRTWHSDVHPHVQQELNHVNGALRAIELHLGFGSIHGPHGPHGHGHIHP